MSFVINKKFARSLNQLEEFKQVGAFALYDGGPVDKEHLFFVHQRPDLIEGSTLISDSIYLGGNFKQAVALLNNKTISETDMKIFIGYCGWEANELEAEIQEGSWIIVNTHPQIIFTTDVVMLWQQLYNGE
jgi:putative transcriptional regulator